MTVYGSFLLDGISARMSEDDILNLAMMPCEAHSFVSPIDNLLRLQLAVPTKKYYFFGPEVYQRTELGIALDRHLFPY